jgi:hypothetical protein
MIVLLFALMLGSSDSSPRRMNADEIIQKSAQAIKHDWELAPEFECSERDREGGGTKTYEDLMIAGSPYQKLISLNGKPLARDQAADEEKKLEQAISERQSESPQQRAQRVAKYEADQKRNHQMMEQMVKAFDFAVTGETRLDGHDVYVLRATPRPGYQPPNMETQALTGMQGRLWIDKSTFQWVKVEAEVTHPVSIEGFLAEVEPGTHFELEKAPVAPGVWLPKHFAMRSHAKILFLIPHDGQEDDTYFNCHEATSVQNPTAKH